jgi:prenyltransferase beta subunit
MQGRTNKLEDTCYSFWIGGTLKILNCDHLLDQKLLRAFVTDCQSDMGGFSKLRDPGRSYYPDLLHSFYSLSWLSFSHTTINEESVINGAHLGSNANGSLTLHPLDCTLGMSSRRIDMYRKGILNSSQIT